ncbi:MAG: pilus assembly protein [Chloroflexota bacterium]|jgi:hypothetical protein
MKRNRSERGQSLVEFGISLVVILFLLAGAVEFGLALFQYIQLRDAAQEGAVYGSICPVEDNIKARVRNHSSSPVNIINEEKAGELSIYVEGRDGTTQNPKDINNPLIPLIPGDGIYVEVSYKHKLVMPFATLFTGGSDAITIRASVTNTVLDTEINKASCK